MAMSRGGPPIRGNAMFWHLVENGPSSMGELNNGYHVHDRQRYDIRRLNPLGRNRGRSSPSLNGQPLAIYYLGQYHDKEQVLRAWIEENEAAFSDGDYNVRQISLKLPSEYMGVWQSVRDEYRDWFSPCESNGGGSHDTEHDECPICEQPLNEENSKNLAQHLPDCPGA